MSKITTLRRRCAGRIHLPREVASSGLLLDFGLVSQPTVVLSRERSAGVVGTAQGAADGSDGAGPGADATAAHGLGRHGVGSLLQLAHSNS